VVSTSDNSLIFSVFANGVIISHVHSAPSSLAANVGKMKQTNSFIKDTENAPLSVVEDLIVTLLSSGLDLTY
jgi:hypothetical protein